MKKQTLHLCPFDHIENINDFIPFVLSGDAVIFYGNQITEQNKQELIPILSNLRCYFLNLLDDNVSNITFDDWVDLIEDYEKTYSWK